MYGMALLWQPEVMYLYLAVIEHYSVAGVRMFCLSVCLSVCLFVCPFIKRVSGSSYTVENASNAALIPTSPEMKPGLAAVGSATVTVLSQASGIAAIFPMKRGHVVYNNCTLCMLLYKQCRGFYCCSKRVVKAGSVFQEHHL